MRDQYKIICCFFIFWALVLSYVAYFYGFANITIVFKFNWHRIYIMWFFISTYCYSTKSPQTTLNLVNYWVYINLISSLQLPDELKILYTILGIFVVVSTFVFGCIFGGGFDSFTVFLAKNILNSPHTDLRLETLAQFWLEYIEQAWPQYLSILSNEKTLMGKIKLCHKIVYYNCCAILMVIYSLFLQYFIIIFIIINLYKQGAWLAVWSYMSYLLVASLGFTFICFDTKWIFLFNSTLGDHAAHRLGYNGTAASSISKTKGAAIVTAVAKGVMETPLVKGAVKTVKTVAVHPNTERAAKLITVGGTIGGGVAAAVVGFEEESSKIPNGNQESTPPTESSSTFNTVIQALEERNNSKDLTIGKLEAENAQLKAQLKAEIALKKIERQGLPTQVEDNKNKTLEKVPESKLKQIEQETSKVARQALKDEGKDDAPPKI